jgi:hypothetical protein
MDGDGSGSTYLSAKKGELKENGENYQERRTEGK